MTEWIACSERLPLQVGEVEVFESIPVIATDGHIVRQCDFDAGNGVGTPWAQWNTYNEIPPSQITHWMPLPSPPAQ
ncbi:DUF551 domain-containing protein [Pseudomonas lactis]|uniref:DUF551 domain-containing protein n=1 Tax=Pseudomonas TaxID=286 RepID=UPI000BB61ADE|nr:MULTISPECIES: DUF551 domain-containing protein [Pseudomonas]MBA5956281.1 DUF551 domain-containing protein [Pseudomonas lactis]PRW80130.1 DUF551 domain-containing protein [Pseudomonas fluorescens]PRW80905.1 DUF551 domain-containing protein [Pseudomonas fluorescens]